MARLFNDAASNYLSVNQAVAASYPYAFACKFRVDAIPSNSVLINCADSGEPDHQTSLIVWNTAGSYYLRMLEYNGVALGAKWAEATSDFALNTWHHAAGICLSTTERHVWLNGANKGSNTDEVGALIGRDKTGIGGAVDSTPGAYLSGDFAEGAVWDLTDWGANDAERETNFEKAIVSMAADYSPKFFPLGCTAYWKLVRGLNDEVGGYNLTASGTTVAAHPRIIYPSHIKLGQGEFPKEFEDFTTYDETDEGNNVTVTADKISWDNLARTHSSHISDSKGANYFSGDFTHQFQCQFSNIVGAPVAGYWALANAQNNWKALADASEDFVMFYNSEDELHLRLYEGGSSVDWDLWAGAIADTLYYVTISRDDTGGANNTGQYTAVIRTTSHTGAIQDTLTVDSSAGEQNDFEYVYGLMSYDDNSAGNTVDGFTQFLYLQKGG